MNADRQIGSVEVNRFHRFEADGFLILNDVLPSAQCRELADELSGLFEAEQRAQRTRQGGLRNLLRTNSTVKALAVSEACLGALRTVIQTEAFPVRAIFFDKTPDANWLVPWHQDLSIAVARQKDVPGFGGWSVKEGVPHVQPPCEVLESMVTLRLHLDDCSADNGALKVLPGSHALGKLSSEQVGNWSSKEAFTCEVAQGGALLMRPLLLHSSSPSAKPNHRRVLHIEYASSDLPEGLDWFEGALNDA